MTDPAELPSRAAMTHESIRGEGIQELKRDGIALLLSAIAAGLSMGISFLVKAKLQLLLGDQPIHELVSNIGYPIGFIIVILSRQQLFTENTLTAVLPILHQQNQANLLKLLRLWSIVLTGNLIGTALITFVFSHFAIFTAALQQQFYSLSMTASVQTASNLFLGSIVSGWLIATMVWMFPAAGAAKIPVIFIMTYLIALFDLPHVIIGSIKLFYLIFHGQTSWLSFFYPFGLPTLAGNILGGTFIFALLSHLQIKSDMKNNADK